MFLNFKKIDLLPFAEPITCFVITTSSAKGVLTTSLNIEKSVRQVILIALAIIGFNAKLALAAAPTAIDLKYDPKEKVLNIDIAHVSHDQNKHYIKKVTVTKNNEEPKTLYFRQQVDHAHFVTQTPLEAQPGDAVKVEAQDSEGGSLTEEMVIPEPESE